jgi:glycosyltransferase involved in cell wall biosynthesis
MAIISVILPTFNGEKYISKSIESCLAQSYKNFELIIVNDCSTDDTLSLINKFAEKDPRIIIINNSYNQKLPASLNTGFANAKGKYFTWTSDDNYFAPNALETLISELDKSGNVDIVYSSYQFINEKNNPLEFFGDEPENLLFKCIIGACFLYRREVHENLNGYAENKFRMEDMDFWLRAAAKFRFKFIDGKNLYYYRKHRGSLTFGVYNNDEIYKQYRQNYLHSYNVLFNEGMNASLSLKELQLHIEIFFEDILQQKNRDFSVSGKLIDYIEYLDKLQNLHWEIINFRYDMVRHIISLKKKRMLTLIINDLVLENKMLSNKNPKLAMHINKPVSWYYKEYEVLPLWYKKFGHIIKVVMGNRPFKSLFKNDPTL